MRALWNSPLAGWIWKSRRRFLGACLVPPQFDGFGSSRKRYLGACPVEFPLSLTTSELRGGDTWIRALWNSPLAGRIRNAAETILGRAPCGVPP